MEFLPLVALLGLMIINVPVAAAIAAGALVFFLYQSGLPLPLYVQRLASSSNSFALLAIPLFTLAGVIMNHAGITPRLLRLADVMVGHMRGSLAQANVVFATLMGGLSGSGYAQGILQAKTLGVEMVRGGYNPGFAAAVVASTAIIDPIIPPGLGFIIYGYLADVSIGRLFIAGIVPGLMLAVGLMIVIFFLARKYDLPRTRSQRASAGEFFAALRDAIWALTVPVVIVGGLRYGIFTPTEAGGVIALYALFVGRFIYRELKLTDLPAILTESTLATSTIMLIICAADAFGFYMTVEEIPVRAAEVLIQITTQPLAMLVLIVLFLLVVGMFVESTAALVLLTPIFVPLTNQVGIDPVHFGLVIILKLTLGALTPPVGGQMFIACSVLDVRIIDYCRKVWPLLAVEFFVLALIIVFPSLITYVPDLLMGPR